MAKTTVSNLISSIKRVIDYSITDTALDTLLLDLIRNAVRVTGQWLMDHGLDIDNTTSGTILTIPNQQYKVLNKATIVGDTTSFTGIAGDKLNVTVDGTTSADIDISACTTIALVVTAINTAVGSTVASETDEGYLRIDSATTGTTSSVTIADGTTAVQTVVGDLFSRTDTRTDTAIMDIDHIIAMKEYDNDVTITHIPPAYFFELYPKPADNAGNPAIEYTMWNGRVYWGPTPTSSVPYYLEYFKIPTELASTDTLPFENKYDALLTALVRMEWMRFMDANNTSAITSAENSVAFYKSTLITNATRNIGMEQGSQSRLDSNEFGPRKPRA